MDEGSTARCNSAIPLYRNSETIIIIIGSGVKEGGAVVVVEEGEVVVQCLLEPEMASLTYSRWQC